MRALFLIPGDAVAQLRVLPAAAAVARTLGFQLQVACQPSAASVWKLLPEVEKLIPFSFEGANLADWANLLGSVREPDFQVCINLAQGRQVDLMLSMSHIPTRIASAGFSATEKVGAPAHGWPAQSLESWLRPIGVRLDADAFRLSLPRPLLDETAASLPSGEGPLLLLAPAGVPGDWPASLWQELPAQIRGRLPALRCHVLSPGATAKLPQLAAQVALSDVVLASDPLIEELALFCGVPMVALGRGADTLPQRQGVRGLSGSPALADLSLNEVMTALGFA